MPPPSSPSAPSLKSRIGLALAFAVLVATTYTFWPRSEAFPFFFEVTMRSAQSGFAQLYYDTGNGVSERDSSRLPLEGGNRPVTYQFPLPEGRYPNFRFDPTDRARNTMTLSAARVVDRGGHLFRVIPPGQMKASQQIDKLAVSEKEVTFATAANADDPILAIELGEPLILKSFGKPSFRRYARRFLISFVVALGAGLAASGVLITRVRPQAARWLGSIIAFAGAHPTRLLCASAALSVILSCYPIVFFGKSFVSPNNHSHTFLLYGEMPTVPGYKEVETDDEKGSDLGAVMWYSWPASVAESRALFKDFELPLWNRYDSSGLPLLGQGQSMFGDPLHTLVLLTRGAAWSWDLKYLLAKFLFAAAIGFCVLQLTKHVPAAVIVTWSAPFIGFYSYRYSHPAFFSMSYAPLVLLCWLKLADRPGGRASPLWLGLMIVANWTVLNSGTVKEAYILLLAMNLCGALALLFTREVTQKVAKLGQACGVLLLFVLIATPVWFTFLLTLRSSRTFYDAGGVFQLQPSLLIGLFDDIFYRQFNAEELHLDPSANFLVLAAVLWFCFASRGVDSRRSSWGISIMAVMALAFVFGVVPPWLILRIPFLDRIYHIDNTFSCIAIVCLLLLSGFGIKAFWSSCLEPTFSHTYLRVLAAFAILLALYLGTTEAAQRSTRAFLHVGEQINKSPFFWGYSFLLIVVFAFLPWIGRSALKAGSSLRPWTVFLLALFFVLIHWRFGMHLHTPFDSYVMNPQSRVSLVADSPAVNLMKSHESDPFRAAGLRSNFFPGYGGAIGVEQIDAADALSNRYYRTLMDASGIKVPYSSSNSGLLDEPIGNDLPLLNMLNVRYYLSETSAKTEVHPSVRKLGALDLDVYESSAVWPRAFFINQLSSYGSESDFVSLLKEGDGKPFAAVPRIDVEKQADLKPLLHESAPSPDREIVAATGYTLTNNTTNFKVRTPGPGVVVLTESYVEGDLQVQLNGKATDYFRVNSAFRGVFVPAAGDYHFSFSYWPRHLTVSLWISALGLVLLAGWIGMAWRQSHRAT